MGNTLTKENITAGELKHKRIISITTAILTFIGVLIASLFLYDTTMENAVINESMKFTGIFSLIGFAILYIVYQNLNLASLERTLGWSEELDEKKIPKFLSKLSKIRDKLLKYREKISLLLDFVFFALLFVGLSVILFIFFNIEELGFIYWIATISLFIVGLASLVLALYTFGKIDW